MASRMQKIRRGQAPGGALGAQLGCTQATLQRRPTGLRRSPLRGEGARLPYERLRQLGLCWFDKFRAPGRRRDGACSGPSARPLNAAPLRASYSHGISGQVRAAHAAQNGRGGAWGSCQRSETRSPHVAGRSSRSLPTRRTPTRGRARVIAGGVKWNGTTATTPCTTCSTRGRTSSSARAAGASFRPRRVPRARRGAAATFLEHGERASRKTTIRVRENACVNLCLWVSGLLF